MSIAARTNAPQTVRSDGEVFERTFEFDADPLLHDHCFRGIGVLPAAAQLEMVLGAAQVLQPESHFVVRDAVFAKPLRVAPRHKRRVHLTLEPRDEGFDFAINTMDEKRGSERTRHVGGRLERTAASSPDYMPLPELPQAVAVGEFYERYARLGLDYGPTFRTIRSLHKSDSEAIAALETPAPDLGYLLHPALVDGALQTLAALVPERDHHGRELITLPFSVTCLRIWQTGGSARVRAHARLQPRSKRDEGWYWGSVTLVDEANTRILQLDGVCLKQLEHSPSNTEVEVDIAPWFHRVRWHAVPTGSGSLPHGRWLLFVDQRGLGEALAQRLQRQGRSPVIVTPGTAFARKSENHWQLDSRYAEQFSALLTEVRNPGEGLAGAVYLWGCDEVAGDEPEAEASWVEHHTLAILGLTRALAAAQATPLWLVSADGTPGRAGDPPPSAAHGALWGLGRVIAVEYPQLSARRVDLQWLPGEVEHMAQQLESELAQDDRTEEVALRDHQRWMPRLEAFAPQKLNPPRFAIRPDGVYLITGGLGGIGLKLAEHLVNKGAGTVYLLSRRALPEGWQESLAQGNVAAGERSALAALLALQRRGARIIPLAADVADEAALKAALARIRAESGALHGAFHAAGVVRDALIARKSPEDVRRTLRPKVLGGGLLARHIAPLQPDFLVLFSSATSVFGNIGQSDYAAANAYLDALAHRLSAQGLPTLTLNWSLWAEVGMGTELVEPLRRRGFHAISNREALAALDAAMDCDETQVVLARFAGSGPSAAVLAPLPQGNVLPTSASAAAMSSPEETRPEAGGSTTRWVRRQVVEALCEQLKLAPEELDIKAPFLDLGIDSIIAVDLVQMLEQRFSCRLRPTLLFEFGSAEELVAGLIREFGVTAPMPLSAEASPPTPADLQGLDRQRPSASPPVANVATSPAGMLDAATHRASSASASGDTSNQGRSIAIIGLAGRFPGADSIDALWRNIRSGIDAISEVPPERWDLEAIFHPEPGTPGRTYGRWGGFMECIDHFDPAFFRLSPKEAKALDPQQRLALELTWEALETAGYASGQVSRVTTGVFMGASYQHYRDTLGTDWVDSYTGLGNHNAILSNRISYFLNCQGPCLTVDTLCSSSLVALHLAVESLRREECELALVGGVHIGLSDWYFRSLSQLRALSPTGRCRAFDEGADGYVPGEGGVVVLLKPLDKARADGDSIRGVICGTAVNHGGRASGLTVPRVEAQAAVIRAALRDADCSPSQLSYVEAHGTGTALGDPIEIEALRKVFGDVTEQRQFCAIGSVKSHIGHLEPAAGLAGLVTVLAAMGARQFPPSLHLRQPNHRITFEDSPFYLCDQPRPWHGDRPRLAGISSFGMGGANAHVVVEEAPPPVLAAPRRETTRLLRLAAQSDAALRELVARFRDLCSDGDAPALSGLCFSANTGRADFEHRIALLIRFGDQLSDKLHLLKDWERRCELTGSMVYASATDAIANRHKLEQQALSLVGQLAPPALALLYGWCGGPVFEEDLAARLPTALPTTAADPNAEEERDWVQLLQALSALYALGVEVDWKALEAAATRREDHQPLRVPLPTYPFQRAIYRLSPTETRGVAATALHPLLDRALPDLEGALFEKRWTELESSLLRDHRFQDQPLLPAAAIVGMVASARDQLMAEDTLTIEDFALLDKGVAVNGLTTRLRLNKSEDALAFTLSAWDQETRTARPLAAGLVATAPAPAASKWQHIISIPTAVRCRCLQDESPAALYEWFSQQGLVYGPTLQVIQSLVLAEDAFVAELTAPARIGASVDYPPAAILDGALQGVGAIVRRGDRGALCLPFAARCIRLAKTGAQRFRVYGIVEAGKSQGEFRAQLLLTDATDDAPVATFQDLRFRGDLAPVAPHHVLPLMFRPIWQRYEPSAGGAKAHWWVIRDDAAAPRALVEALRARGDRVIETHHGTNGRRMTHLDFSIQGDGQHRMVFWPASGKIAEDVLLALLGLVQRLAKANVAQLDLRVVVPTLQGEAQDWEYGSLAGMMRVIARENPGWRCQIIGLGTADDPQAPLTSLLRVLDAPPTEPELCLEGARVLVPAWEPLAPSTARGQPLKTGGLYLITGGLGAIGLALARHLAERHQARLVLVSRRGAPTRGPAHQALTELQRAGAEVHVLVADLTDPATAATLWADVEVRFGTPEGVFHFASVVRDGLLKIKSAEDFAAVLAPKMSGLRYLADFSGLLVLFSSVSSFSGNLGQGDYAAANRYLDLFAEQRAKRGLPTLAINWGLWGELGAGPELVETTRARGFEPLTTASAIAALEVALACGAPRIAVPGADLAAVAAARLPKLDPDLARFAEGPPSRDYEDALALVVECLAAQLEIPPAQVIPRRPFLEMGMDSIAAVQLVEILGRRSGIKLPRTTFFDYATPYQLAQALVDQHGFLQRRDEPPAVSASVALEADTAAPPLEDDAVNSEPTQPSGDAPIGPKAARASSHTRLDHQDEAIAVIGMAGRFPGAACPEDYWRNLIEGRDCITEVPANRWRWQHHYHPDTNVVGKTYSKWGGFLTDIEHFDAQFFRLFPREAEALDPQHRLLLECAWECIENAAHAPDELSAQATGVYVGASYSHYRDYHVGPLLDAYTGLGNHNAILANRLSYFLDLRGPCMTVDTLCSSSLVALHLAVRALRGGECRQALAAGVQVGLSPWYYQSLSRLHALSPDGRCKSFDHRANGYVPGEGVGVVLLKPLARALAEGDHVYGLILGSAVNHGGQASGLTVPNGAAQTAVIRAALSDAGVSADTIGYVEAHGTGTALGDPIELTALTHAFREDTERRAYCAIGSVKSQIGHLEPAAGIAGLIKVMLALEAHRMPPSLHFEAPNSECNFVDSPFFVNTRAIEWRPLAGTRRAGLSSFGLGGVNAHVVLEQAPEAPARHHQHPDGGYVLALSARSQTALARLVADYAALENRPRIDVRDLCFSANAGRAHHPHRLALAAATPEVLRQRLKDAKAALMGQEGAGGAFYGYRGEHSRPPKVAFLFTGQGAQYAAMGRQLYRSEPVFRAALERCAEVLDRHLDVPLLALLYGDNSQDTQRIHHTRYAQPALFALGYALVELWASWGIHPVAVLGHSLGELTAAWAAGVMSLEEALTLVAERGRLMQSQPLGEGAMAALFAPRARLQAHLDGYSGLAVAAENGPRQTVVSGYREQLERLLETLDAAGVKGVPLRTSHGFHSPQMDAILDAFRAVAGRIAYRPPRIPLISNLTGEALVEAPDAHYWCRHLRSTVLFAQGLETLRTIGVDICVEIGPKPILNGMAQEVWGKTVPCIPSLNGGDSECATLVDGLAQLYARGAEVKWAALYRSTDRRRLPLPTYPFQRQRYWLPALEVDGQAKGVRNNAPVLASSPAGHGVAAPLPEAPGMDAVGFFQPTWKPLPTKENARIEPRGQWLIFNEGRGLGAEVAQWLRGHGAHPILVDVAAAPRFDLAAGSASIRMDCAQDYEELVGHTLERGGADLGGVLHLWACCQSSGDGDEAAQLREGLRRGLDSVLLLAQALATLEHRHTSLLSTIPCLVMGERAYIVDGEQAPRLDNCAGPGLVRSLAAEFSRLRWRYVDSGEVHPRDAGALIAEALRAGDEPEIVLRDGVRYRRGLSALVREAETPRLSPLRPRGVYVITGGLGGIGQAIAAHLARHYQARLVLMGRKPLPPRTHWRNVASEDGELRQRLAIITELEALGGEVHYVAGDVGCEADVRRLYREAEKSFGAVHGVFHAAGFARRPASLVRKTQGQIHTVLTPKLWGTYWLAKYAPSDNLDALVLFSSASGINAILARGLGDYALANAAMDRCATWLRATRSLPVISLLWPEWLNTGMAKDTGAGRSSADAGLPALSLEQGVQGFSAAWALAADNALVVAKPGSFDAEVFLAADHRRAALPPNGASTTVPLGDIADVRSAVNTGLATDAASQAESAVLTALGEVLKVTRGDLDPERGFAEIGMDSLLIADMVVALERLYGQHMEPAWILEHPSPRRLAAHLAQQFGMRLTPPAQGNKSARNAPAETEIRPCPSGPGADKLSQLLTQLKNGELSLDHAEQLLECW